MSRCRSESSMSSDIEALNNEEEDEWNQAEDPVEILVQGFLETKTKIDGFRDQPHEMRALAKKAAYDTLFEQIGKLKNVKGALDKVEYLLKEKIPEEIPEESSVELIEKSFVQPLNDTSVECSQKPATKELYFERARTTAIEQFNSGYDELMKKNAYRSVAPQTFDDQLKELVTLSIEAYNSITLFGTQEEKDRVFDEFKRNLEDRCAEKSKSNRDRFRDIQISEAVQGSYDKYEETMRPNFEDMLQGNQTVELLREKHEKAHRQALSNFETVVEPFNDEESLVNEKRALLEKMIQSRFANLEKESFVTQINAGLRGKIAELVEFHETGLKKSVMQVHKMDQAEEKVGEIKALLEAKYNVEKTKLAIQIKQQMPELDIDMINNIIDNYKEKSVDWFKKCEDTFISDARNHIQIERVKQQFANHRQKHSQQVKDLQKRCNQERTNVKELKEKIDHQRNDPIWIMMQQMREETERRSERQIRLDEAMLAAQMNQIQGNIEVEKLRLAAAAEDRRLERIDREVEEKMRRAEAKEEKKPAPPSAAPPSEPSKSRKWFGLFWG